MGQNHRWPSHLHFGKTIEKPSMSMVNLGKNIQWWWSGCSKTIEKPSKAMVLRKKNITIPSFEKNDHRWSLNPEKFWALQVKLLPAKLGQSYKVLCSAFRSWKWTLMQLVWQPISGIVTRPWREANLQASARTLWSDWPVGWLRLAKMVRFGLRGGGGLAWVRGC